MGLKIPGVGKVMEEFEWSVAPNSNESVIVRIAYSDKGRAKKVKLFELKCDDRFKTAELIIKTVSECLFEAKTKQVEIREIKERAYIYFDHLQYTGFVLTQK